MELTTMEVTSKPRNNGVIDSLSLTQNLGPSFNAKSNSFLVSSWTTKNLLERK